MILGAVVYLALASWFGFCAVSLLGRRAPEAPGRVLRAALGVGFGLGGYSLLAFFWLEAFGRWSAGLNALLLAVTLLMTVLARAGRLTANRKTAAGSPGAGVEIRQILGFYFCLALAFALVIGIIYFLNNPHGNWDAWSHYNLRARFIMRGGARWTDALHPDYWNPLNYPLMMPTVVAAGWGWLGRESPWIPGLIALGFATATVLLLTAALARLRGAGQGLLAGILLLGTPFFLTHGASQYADIPLAFFFLATFVGAAFYDAEERPAPVFLALAGLAAGFAAWTKNEGLLFIGCFSLVRFGGTLLGKGPRALLREVSAFALGLLPVLAVDFYVKTRLYPARSIFETRGVPYDVHKFSDPARYWKILQAFRKTAYSFGQWWLSLPLLLAGYALWVGLAPASGNRRGAGRVLGVVVLMLAGYFGVYLSTPHNLDWHLATSVDRLFLCLWPSALFGLFLLLRSPEEVLSAAAAPSLSAAEEGVNSSCI